MFTFFKKTKKEPEDIRDVLKRLKELEKENKELAGKLNKSLQKIGMVRFNPFGEVGGDQSFSIAALDADNNGFVITSHYGHESNRVYAKPIGGGKSSHSLSAEEEKAIRKAVSS